MLKKRFATLDAISLDASCADGATTQPGTQPDSVLVVFHGYGATAEDLLPLAPSFAEAMPNTAQVFLQAPDPCFAGSPSGSHSGGQSGGRAWFPLQHLSYEEIVSGLKAVEGCVSEALQEISAQHNVPFERIALFGFSQGGMVVLQAACQTEHAWLAAVGIATRFVEPPDLRATASHEKTPLMMIHGEQDDIVPFQQGLKTASMLREKGYDLAWLAREGMGHAIDQTALQSACDFLRRMAQKKRQEEMVS